jgi:hypothetical protein
VTLSGEEPAKITAAIREVVNSPATAVLPAFLNVAPAQASTTVTPQQKDLLEIRQDLDLLKREVGGEVGSLGLDRRTDIGPLEARRLIAHLIRRGAAAELIVRRVRPLGPPAGWIESTITELRRNKRLLSRLLREGRP